MRNTIITTILLFIAVIGASIYYFANIDGDKKETLRPLTYLPKETFLITTFHNDATTDNIFKDYEVFEAMVGKQEMQQWQSLKTKVLRNNVLQPYVKDVDVYLSLHPQKDRIATLFTIPTIENVSPEGMAAIMDQVKKSYTITQKDTLGNRIFNLDNGIKDSVFHVLYYKHIFFASYSDSLLYNIINEKTPKLDKEDIDYFIENNSRNSPLSIYFVHDQVAQIAKHVMRKKMGNTLNLFENLGGKSAWNMNFKNDALILSGESVTKGDKHNYLEIFGRQAKTTQSLYNYFPENTASYISFAISDTAIFRQDLNALFTLRNEQEQLHNQFAEMKRSKDISFEQGVRPAFGREFAVVEQSNQTELAFIALGDTSQWEDIRTSVSSETGDSIRRFDHSNIPFALFGDPLKSFSRPYFLQINNVLVLANNQSLLQSYRREWKNIDLLINTLGFKTFEKTQGNEANVTYFLRTHTASNIVSNLLKESFNEDFRNKENYGYQDFYSWSIQISGNNGRFLSNIYGIYKSKNALGATPEWTYEFDNKPISAPWVFEHSDTSEFILIQEQDHTVHGIHPTGKKLWSALFHGRIVGEPQQLSDRSIVLVTDRNELYRFDTEGNSLPGFSVKMGNEPTYTPTITQINGQQLIFVPAGQNMLVYTDDGKKADGWETKSLDGKILYDIKVRDEKVYVGTETGHFYQFNNTGELLKEDVVDNSTFKSPIALTVDEKQQNSICAIDTNGNIVYVNFQQAPAKKKFGSWGPKTIIAFDPQGNDPARTAIIIDQKQLFLKGLQGSSTQYDFTFTLGIEDRPQLFKDKNGTPLLGISSRENSLLYLFNDKAVVLDGFPIDAQPDFYYGKVDYNSSDYLLCVRKDRKLYAFKH